MSLTIMRDLVQGTEEWMAARRGLVTASAVGQLLTPTLKVAANDTSRRLTRLIVAMSRSFWTITPTQRQRLHRQLWVCKWILYTAVMFYLLCKAWQYNDTPQWGY